MDSNESEVRELLDVWVDACQEKDIDRLMSLYSADIVYYDVVPPLRLAGRDEVRRNFVGWFDEYDGPIGLEPHDLTVATSVDVAFTTCLSWTAERATTGSRAGYGYGRLFVAEGQMTSG